MSYEQFEQIVRMSPVVIAALSVFLTIFFRRTTFIAFLFAATFPLVSLGFVIIANSLIDYGIALTWLFVALSWAYMGFSNYKVNKMKQQIDALLEVHAAKEKRLSQMLEHNYVQRTDE